MANPAPIAVEERVVGVETWVTLRGRSLAWSWLTPDEAAEVARSWLAKYSK